MSPRVTPAMTRAPRRRRNEARRVESRTARFALYGLIGWCAEVIFTGAHDFVRTRDPRLPSRPSLWMFPVYVLMQPLYEPVHDAIRHKPAATRAAVYGAGFLAVEYATGWTLRRALGAAPWDYSYARHHVNGLIRPAYFPYWAAAGLAMERVHDRLTEK